MTGSNDVTLSDPNSSLKRMLKVAIFPKVKQLVRPGGDFENAQVAIKGDRDQTHDDTSIQTLVNEYF